MTVLRSGAFLIGAIVLAIYAIVMIFKKVPAQKFFMNLAFGAYLAFIIAMCFFPIKITPYGEDVANNLIPFKSIVQSFSESFVEYTPYGLVSVFGNFAMLMPLGVFFHYYIKDYKMRFLWIVLFSVCIELVQFIIGLLIGYNYRCVDIDDVILNSIGGIIILLIFEGIIKQVKKRKSQSRN